MANSLITMSINPGFVARLSANLAEQSIEIARYLVCRDNDLATQEAARLGGWQVLPIVDETDTFASGHNKASKQMEGDLVFLSDDALFMQPTGLAGLLCSPHPITGVLITSGDDRINHAGHKYVYRRWRWQSIHQGRDEPLAEYHGRGYINAMGTTFACVYIKRNVWDELGGLDEQFLWGWEDVDFCLRVRKAGYSIAVDTNCLVYHAEMATRKDEHDKSNRKRLRAKHRTA